MHALSPTIQTLYSELLQQLVSAPIAGSVYTRSRDQIEYHYAKIPVGSSRIDRFIGRVGDPEADAKAEAFADGMRLARERRRLVAMLRNSGLAAPDRMLGAALDAIAHAGIFRDGGVVVGTAAYLMSEPFVGHRLPAPTLMTGDLDLATINLAITADPPEPFEAILQRADPSFQPVLQLDPRQLPVRFRNGQGYLVDLLTQTRRHDERPVALQQLAAAAEPLQHLAWLIDAPLPAIALWGSGVQTMIPQPARFAVHKLILAQRRSPLDRSKRQKDLAQANALIEALRTADPFSLEDALEDARDRGPNWVRSISRSLSELGRDERSDPFKQPDHASGDKP